MSEALLYGLSQQLRLLARRSVDTTQDGRLLRGRINPVIEAMRLDLLAVLEMIQDGLPAPENASAILAECQAAVAFYRTEIRDLRRQVEH